MPDVELLISNAIAESIDVKTAMRQTEVIRACAVLASAMARAFQNGNKVLLFGNGGSAADAQHIAAELVGRFSRERNALPALALNENTSTITAIANDYSFDAVYARQIEALGRPGDIAIGISTSGQSINVIEGLRVARSRGLLTAAFAGKTGGAVIEHSDCCLRVPSESTPRIQECHILLGHALCEAVEYALGVGRE